VASGVREAQWVAAELYPTNSNEALSLTDEQRHGLAQFGG
jgi:hypothetical protein